MVKQNFEQKIFVPSKIHTKNRRLVLLIEILVIVFVVAGTLFSIFRLNSLSVSGVLSKIKEILVLKKPTVQKIENENFEEKVRTEFAKLLLNVTSVESSRGFYTVNTKEGVTVILGGDKDLPNQLETLQTLLSKAKIESRQIVLVDFRFDKLVVRYSQ